jgi:hypothetical protein
MAAGRSLIYIYIYKKKSEGLEKSMFYNAPNVSRFYNLGMVTLFLPVRSHYKGMIYTNIKAVF